MAVGARARRHEDNRSRRTLKLPEIAVEALRRQRQRQARERADAGELWQERGLVFTTSVGTGYESHNLRRDFRRVTAAAGLGARWVPKELRTSFVSMMSYQSKERPTLAVPGKPWRTADPVPGDAPSARWEMPVTVRHDTDGFDFSGPYVRGARDDRNLFLAWGDVRDDGTMRLVRGSKIKLTEVDPRLVEEAMRPGHRLVARIRLTGTAGEPGLAWSAEAAHGQPGSG